MANHACEKSYIELTDQERTTLEQILRFGEYFIRKLTREPGFHCKLTQDLADEDVAQDVDTCVPVVECPRKRIAQFRLVSLDKRPRPRRKQLLDEEMELISSKID
jgi:hypothetical protein